MSRIRVVFSIGAMHGGGSERQLILLLRHLNRTQFEPFLYLVYRTGPLLDLVPADVPVTSFEERVRASRLYLPGRNHALRVSDFARYLREVDADVSYDRTFLMTLIAAAGAQRVGVPNISTVVTNPEVGFAPVAGRFQWFKRKMLHRLYNRSVQVLAVSEGARQAAIRFYGIREEKIATLRNGVDSRLILEDAKAPGDDAWWTRDASPGKCRVFRIVSAGRLNHEKGFHLLIDAVSDLRHRNPDIEFRTLILGEGPHHALLQQRVQSLGLSDLVHLPGFRPRPASWFRSADVFVLPSLTEGMPNVLLEAMICGTPVVSSNCQSGPAEILAAGQLGELVAVDDSQALQAGIQRIFDNPEFAASRATTARQVAIADWSIEAATQNLEQVLENASRRRKAR